MTSKQKSRSFTRAGGFLQGGSDTNITTQILPQDNIDAIPSIAGQEAGPIEAPAAFQPLTSIQLEAIDLHRRGLNVIPLPRPSEVRLVAQIDTHFNPNDKPPFSLRPFYTGRLHRCANECKRNGCKLPEGARFEDLFINANIGVMVGATSGNLVDIDCDTQEAYKRTGEELAKQGIFAWQYASSRGGHYLLLVQEGELANTKHNGVEIYGNLHYAVLPPSLHPSGVFYCWQSVEPRQLPPNELPQMVSVDALAFLGARLKRSRPMDLHGLPEYTACLSDANRRILADGINGDLDEGERNNKLAKAAHDLAANANAGMIDLVDAEKLLLQAAAGCGLPQGEVISTWRHALRKKNTNRAKDHYTGSGNVPNGQAWQIANAFAEAFDWRAYGRMAQSARATFRACVERSKIEGETFRASVRETQELANFADKKTAHKMLVILASEHTSIKGGVVPALIHKQSKSISNANTYKFTDTVLQSLPVGIHKNGTVLPTWYVNVPSLCISKHDLTHNATTPAGVDHTFDAAKMDVFIKLGKVALRVYEHLLLAGGVRSISSIAKQTGQHYESVRMAIKRLMAHGLVTHNTAEQLYFAEVKTTHDLELLAAVLGTLGTQDKRKRQHRDEREMLLNKRVFKARLRWRNLVRYARQQQELLDNNN